MEIFFHIAFSGSIYEPNPLPTKMICDFSQKVLVVLYDPMFGPLTLKGYMGNKRHFQKFFPNLMKCKHIHNKIKHFVKDSKNAKNIKKKVFNFIKPLPLDN